MQNYRYTQNWFLGSEIRQKIFNFVNPNVKHTILEIGMF